MNTKIPTMYAPWHTQYPLMCEYVSTVSPRPDRGFGATPLEVFRRWRKTAARSVAGFWGIWTILIGVPVRSQGDDDDDDDVDVVWCRVMADDGLIRAAPTNAGWCAR